MALPNGFTMRPITMEDASIVTEFVNICAIEVTGKPDADIDEVRNKWGAPSFDITADTCAIFAANGELAAYIGAWYQSPFIKISLWFRVHPYYRSLGLGDILLDWGMQRATDVLALAPPDTRFTVRSWLAIADKDAYHLALLKKHGFTAIRYFNRMCINLDDAPPIAAFPEGITLRTFNRAEDLPTVIRADDDAFRDHWGHVETPFEEQLKDWSQWIDGKKDFDPTLWFLAMDGDEIAAVCLCEPKSTEDPDMGWIGTLGVRRPWRRQGLGLALLYHSFGVFYKRGKKRVGLSVDADSLTGALRLYERAGMRNTLQETIFEKELRAGKEMITRDLEE